MKINEYIKESARTESPNFDSNNIAVSTLHGIIGVSTEAGELLGAVKKALFYGQKLDKENVREEIGDIMWYLSAIIRGENWNLEEILQENIDKLQKRYPEKFSKEHAVKRLDKNQICNECDHLSFNSEDKPICSYYILKLKWIAPYIYRHDEQEKCIAFKCT